MTEVNSCAKETRKHRVNGRKGGEMREKERETERETAGTDGIVGTHRGHSFSIEISEVLERLLSRWGDSVVG